MKNIICTLLLLAPAMYGATQKPAIGFMAGINTTHLHISDGVESFGGNSVGFQVGGIGTIPLTKHISIVPQVLFTQRRGPLYAHDITMNTIEMPVNLCYTSDGFFAGVGASIGYGLSSKSIYSDINTKLEYDLYDKENNFFLLKRVTFHANALIGYRFPGGLAVTANFSPGLQNLPEDGPEGLTIKNKTYGFSLGYFLN
jgi:outer membrane protein with beta-barrel domain